MKTTFWTKIGNFFKKVWTLITTIATWISSVLEDQGTSGSISSKRVTLGAALYMLYKIVIASLVVGGVVNQFVLYAIIGVILTCLGTISAEFWTAWGPNGFNRNQNNNKPV